MSTQLFPSEADDERHRMAEWAEAASLDEMIAWSRNLLRDVQDEVRRSHALTATLGLFSGGNDSTTFMHLLRSEFDSAVHVNTGIGVAETRQYVRDCCTAWDLPLIVERPPPGASYRDLVLAYGFPGPASHRLMYSMLKERALREVRRQHVSDHRAERVLFVAGMRYFESDRRSRNTEATHRDGSVVWCSPLIWWTGRHMAEYRERFEVPRNEVSDNLHMSGECLCGSYAAPGELDHLRFWYPETAAEIDALAAEAKALQVPCLWGERPPPRNQSGSPRWVCMCGEFHRDPEPCQRGSWSLPVDAPSVDGDGDVGPLCAKCEQLDLWEVTG